VSTISFWQLLVAACAALLFGVSKAGLSGIALLGIALWTLIFPARETSGATLPLLLVGDVVALLVYRRHALWPQLLRVFPWALAGIVAGYFALGWMNDRQLRYLIGGQIVLLTVFQYLRQRAVAAGAPAQEERTASVHPLYSAGMGIGAGFATMLANAAGPIMVLYLLAMRLPKLAFIGTSAWFFFLVNMIKIPFIMQLGLFNAPTLQLDLLVAPLVVVGVLGGRQIVTRINQRWFEQLALFFALVGGLRLLF
jgi:uncharacterized membrane protein YfcA